MMGLKLYTGGSAKKSKKDSSKKDVIKTRGWSDEARKFMVKMTKDIKEDVDSRAHRQWEKVYKKICNAVKELHDQESDKEEVETDYSVLYCEQSVITK